MVIKCQQHHRLSIGATRIVRVDYTEDLDTSEVLTGTPTVLEVGTSDLTLATSDVIINTATYVDNDGVTVAVGKAVLFSALGGSVASSPYIVKVTANTDSVPAQVLPYHIELSFE